MERAKREWVIFNALEQSAAPLTLRELGRATNIELSTLGADLNSMVRDGVVQRMACEAYAMRGPKVGKWVFLLKRAA